MAKKLTRHGKQRLRERQTITTDSVALLRGVKLNGKTMYHYKGEFYKYLLYKFNKYHTKIKIHTNNVYFLSTGGMLITMQPIPKKFLPISNYEIDDSLYNLIKGLIDRDGERVCIHLESGIYYIGHIVAKKYQERTFIRLNVNGKIIKIKGEEIIKVKHAKEKVSEL